MTRKRTWLALGALLTAVVVGTVWAADQGSKPPDALKPSVSASERVPADPPAPPVNVGCSRIGMTNDKPCCEGKCCTAEKAKSCCADGKCCGCCDKGKLGGLTLPILPGSTVELLVTAPQSGDATYQMRVPDQCVPSLPPGCTGTVGCSSGLQFGFPQMPQAPTPAPCLPPMPQSPQYVPVTQYMVAPQAINPPMPPPPCPMQPCVPVLSSPWKLKAVMQKDHACVEMQLCAGGEDACAYCDDMVLKIGQEKVKVSIVEKQLQVQGSFFKGSADCVTRNPMDGSVQFEGHVKLTYAKAGQKADVSAERVVLGIADGRLEVKPAEQQQVFSFWTGFCR